MFHLRFFCIIDVGGWTQRGLRLSNKLAFEVFTVNIGVAPAGNPESEMNFINKHQPISFRYFIFLKLKLVEMYLFRDES